MSSLCHNELEVSSHMSLKNNDCINGDFIIIQQYGSVVGTETEGYKLQADHSIAKPARKRNKKRVSGSIVDYELNGTKLVSRLTHPASSEQILGNGSTTNSYAAVVSGRGSRDGDMASLFNFPVDQVSDDFIPSFSCSATSILGSNTIPSRSSVLTRDASVQVNLPISTDVSKGSSKFRSQGTMTTKKVQFKDKVVSVKTCCKEAGELVGKPIAAPVQFLGECFTFENALAKTVDMLGIKFVEWNDDDKIQIHPK